MKKVILSFLFLFFTFCSFAQNNSIGKAVDPPNSNISTLQKTDESVFNSQEQLLITEFITSVSPKVTYYSFSSGKLLLTLATGCSIFDFMEGLKSKGISVVYYSGKEMFFVNDNMKIESWSIK